MSAGAFTSSRYAAEAGTIHPIRVQPETLAATIGGTANDPPAGAANSKISARVSNGNRQFGLKPRRVSFKFTGALPTGYKADQVLTIPALTKAFWDLAIKDAEGTYLGLPIKIVSSLSEQVR